MSDYVKNSFETYLNVLIHEWLKMLTILGCTLVPAFFILDYFTMPNELLPRFGLYRLASTIIVLTQFIIIRNTHPSPRSFLHGYIVSITISGSITMMTVDLGGFNSAYYAGLNLVITGVNLILPWKVFHAAINSLIIILMYIGANLIFSQDFSPSILVNNLFFLFATALISVSINYLKYNLVAQEFNLRIELQDARDSLWSEMELAKRIQTALLPKKEKIRGFEIAAAMLPAEEVGGDYYDVVETPNGNKWVAIGDVSGHGVDSGLIMMMAQTSILSLIHSSAEQRPSSILDATNDVIRENILRLNSDHYMTMMALLFHDSEIVVSGKHQDIIIYRAALNTTEVVPTVGPWLGIADDIKDYLHDQKVRIDKGDIVLLFTDGITEATNKSGEMFGQVRLEHTLSNFANLPTEKIVEKILSEVNRFQETQSDDMTLLIIKKIN